MSSAARRACGLSSPISNCFPELLVGQPARLLRVLFARIAQLIELQLGPSGEPVSLGGKASFFRGFDFYGGRCSHAPPWRSFRGTANRPASLAHVLRAVYRLCIHILGTPATFPGCTKQNTRTFSCGYLAADNDGFSGWPGSCSQRH